MLWKHSLFIQRNSKLQSLNPVSLSRHSVFRATRSDKSFSVFSATIRIDYNLHKTVPEKTLVIIKPDAVERNLTTRILSMIESAGLRLVAIKSLNITKEEAKEFYHVHKGKDFFESLTTYMSSGKIVVAVFEGDDAIARVRNIMGATDPKKASDGTIRKLYGIDVEKNSIHGSDSKESAEFEISFFFSKKEII